MYVDEEKDWPTVARIAEEVNVGFDRCQNKQCITVICVQYYHCFYKNKTFNIKILQQNMKESCLKL